MHRPFLWERECGYFVRAYLQGYAGLKLEMDNLAPDFEHLLARGSRRPLTSPASGLRVPQPDHQERPYAGHQFPGRAFGPLGYDLAALLIDPYVNLKPPWQEELLAAYLDLLEKRLPDLDRQAFRGAVLALGPVPQLADPGGLRIPHRERGKSVLPLHSPGSGRLRRRLGERPANFPCWSRRSSP